MAELVSASQAAIASRGARSVHPARTSCEHPFGDEWFANLDQTPYRGWRPSRSAYLAGQARRLGQRVNGRLRPRPD
jgi:hypothetical protein